MPIYEYLCAHCGTMNEKFIISHKKKEKTIECEVCENDAFPVLSRFNTSPSIFVPLAGVDDTDDFTIGKLVADGKVPTEIKRNVRDRIKTYNEGKAEYEHRQRQLKFKEDGTTIE